MEIGEEGKIAFYTCSSAGREGEAESSPPTGVICNLIVDAISTAHFSLFFLCKEKTEKTRKRFSPFVLAYLLNSDYC